MKAQVAIFFESLPENFFQSRRDCGIQLRRRNRIEFENGVKNHRRRCAGKRPTSSRHLVDHDAQGKQIRPGIQFLTASLFRRHVSDGSNSRSGAGQVHRSGRVLRSPDGFHRHLGTRQLGKAEVQHLQLPAIRNEYVRGFNVAVDDTFRVRGVERICELDTPLHQAIQRHRPGSQAAVQSLALQQFHGDERLLMLVLKPGFFHRIDRADVGMVQSRRSAGLKQETIQSVLITRELRRKKLQRHPAPQVEVFGAVDNSHSAAA